MKSPRDNFDPDALLAMRGTWAKPEGDPEDLDFNSIIASQKADLMEQAQEIANLIAEVERLTRVVEQAIEFCPIVERNGYIWCDTVSEVTHGLVEQGCHRKEFPDLYAHLEADRG